MNEYGQHIIHSNKASLQVSIGRVLVELSQRSELLLKVFKTAEIWQLCPQKKRRPPTPISLETRPSPSVWRSAKSVKTH